MPIGRKMPIGTKYADWNEICRLDKQYPMRPSWMCVCWITTDARTRGRNVCACACVCTCARALSQTMCVRVCLRAYVCVRVCVHVHAHRFQTSEVQKIIVAALPRAHPMERMAKSSAWPMDRAWPKEKAPQR